MKLPVGKGERHRRGRKPAGEARDRRMKRTVDRIDGRSGTPRQRRRRFREGGSMGSGGELDEICSTDTKGDMSKLPLIWSLSLPPSAGIELHQCCDNG